MFNSLKSIKKWVASVLCVSLQLAVILPTLHAEEGRIPEKVLREIFKATQGTMMPVAEIKLGEISDELSDALSTGQELTKEDQHEYSEILEEKIKDLRQRNPRLAQAGTWMIPLELIPKVLPGVPALIPATLPSGLPAFVGTGGTVLPGGTVLGVGGTVVIAVAVFLVVFNGTIIVMAALDPDATVADYYYWACLGLYLPMRWCSVIH